MGETTNNWLVIEDKTCGALSVISQINMSYYYDGAILHKAQFDLKQLAGFETYGEAIKYKKEIEEVDKKINEL